MINKVPALLVCSLILFLSCNNPDKTKKTDSSSGQASIDSLSGSTGSQDKANLDGYLKKHEEPSQDFIVSSSNPSEVKGKKGTLVSIKPSDLERLDGKPLGTNVQ